MNEQDDLILKLQEDLKQYKELYESQKKDLHQQRETAKYWKQQYEWVGERAKRTVHELNELYKSAFSKAVGRIRKYPGGKCKGCDLNSLAAEIEQLHPVSLE